MTGDGGKSRRMPEKLRLLGLEAISLPGNVSDQGRENPRSRMPVKMAPSVAHMDPEQAIFFGKAVDKKTRRPVGLSRSGGVR